MNLKAYDLLKRGSIIEAAELFNEVLEYIGYEPSARLGLAIVGLFCRKLDLAYKYLINNFKHTDDYYPVEKLYDPIEVAHLALIFFCDNNPDGVALCLSYAGDMRHPALNAAKTIITSCSINDPESTNLLSRIPMNEYAYNDWMAHFNRIVRLCK